MFKKDLSSILAPLDKIYNNLSKFISDSTKEMDRNRDKVVELQNKNSSITIEVTKASTVLDNIYKLLGN